MRFLKILFSRTILVLIGFIIQFALLFWFLFLPVDYVYIFHAICIFLSFFAFLDIINKNHPAEFKLPWLFTVLIFPILGLFLYVAFANRKLSRKQIKNISATKKRINDAQIPVHDKRAVKDFLQDKKFIEQYLINTSNSFGHLNNKIEYIDSGEKFFEQLKFSLRNAQSFIFLEYFVIADGKMWSEIQSILLDKVREGVEIRVIYDDIGSLGRVNVKFYKQLKKLGIKCVKFNPFRPILSGIHNNRDHRKIAVIDGKIGFTGGINIADEYINITHPHGQWKDCAIKIVGSAVTNLTAMFLETFDGATKEISDYKRYLHINHEVFENMGYVHVFGDAPKPFDKELIGENTFINLINTAKQSIYITTPYLVIDYTLQTALRNASLKGVDVKIITPHVPDKKIVFNVTRSHYGKLMDAGIKIYEYTPGFMHAKSIVVDNELAFVGTINMDYRSLVHHFECGAILYKTPCISNIVKDFEKTLNVSEQITKENFKMSKFTLLINSMLAIFFPML